MSYFTHLFIYQKKKEERYVKQFPLMSCQAPRALLWLGTPISATASPCCSDVACTLAGCALMFLKEETFFPCAVKSGGRWVQCAKYASF